MYSVKGETEEATKRLRLLFYLRELERQADVFGRAFADALDAAGRDDPVDAWRHIQSAMFAAIVVNRLLTNDQPWHARRGWSREQARAAARWRVRGLRRVVGLPDPGEIETPVYKVAAIRDSLEHVDERIDRALWSPDVLSLSDWYISDGHFRMSADPTEGEAWAPAGLRAFHPESGLLFFDRKCLDMFQLDVDMLHLRHNATEARAELERGKSGLNASGGGQLVYIDERCTQERFERWQRERAAMVTELKAPAPIVPTELVVQDDDHL